MQKTFMQIHLSKNTHLIQLIKFYFIFLENIMNVITKL